MTFVLNCTNFKKIHQRKRKIFAFIFGHFYACDVILFPDYQLISRQISNQLARGHKTIGSHLNGKIKIIARTCTSEVKCYGTRVQKTA